MAKGFGVNAHRVDPYKNFKFRVVWDGRVVMGISKCGSLKRSTEVVKHREGGENSTDHKSPGRTTYEGLSMERGVTHDVEFEAWANRVHPFSGDYYTQPKYETDYPAGPRRQLHERNHQTDAKAIQKCAE